MYQADAKLPLLAGGEILRLSESRESCLLNFHAAKQVEHDSNTDTLTTQQLLPDHHALDYQGLLPGSALYALCGIDQQSSGSTAATCGTDDLLCNNRVNQYSQRVIHRSCTLKV